MDNLICVLLDFNGEKRLHSSAFQYAHKSFWDTDYTFLKGQNWSDLCLESWHLILNRFYVFNIISFFTKPT